jgi:diguanylate cyclase (GGDEF)-like protein
MLVAQLDYIYFFFGLVLFLLGAVCVSMSRSAPVRTPWWLLGTFAFVHGAGEWLQLLALTGGDSGVFSLARTIVIGASFVVLFEFARRTSGVLGGTTPGSWVYLPIVAAVLGIALTAGLASLDSAVRLFIGAPAIFWTASLFFVAASRTGDLGGGDASWRARILGGLFFVAFGVAAGLVVPKAPYLTEQWPSPDAFLAWTGIPIQLVRGLLVSGMALSVWALAVSFDPKGRVLRKKRLLFWAMASAIMALLAAGWLFTDRLGRLHERDVIQDAESSASQAYDHLIVEMQGAERGARTLAQLLGRYHVSEAGIDVSRLDGVVDSLAVGSADSVVYVLDSVGKTVASSNRGEPDSFLGKSFARRPYFEAARDGRPGRFTGVGLVSHIPGYYASEPVRDASGRLLAVAVVKQNLTMGQLGSVGTDHSSIVSADGRIVVTSRPGGEGRHLWNAPGRTPRAMVSGDGSGEPPSLLDREVTGTEWVSLDGQKYVVVRRQLPNSDWSLVAFKKERTQVANRLLGIVITLLLCAVVLTYFVAMQRQLSAESYITVKRREAEGRAREMAKRADTDALTGVLNRMGFNDAISRELSRARRYQQTLSVAIADIDHFKKVNDEFGHPVGDQVLVRTARLLSSCVRESDTVARWGGEEFAVIAPMTTEEGAASLAEKLRTIMAATHLGPKEAVTASFGVAELRPDDTVETLLQRADAALYRAKQSGRNQVCRAGPVQGSSAQAPATSEDVTL